MSEIMYELCKEYLNVFCDDWKFDHEYLSEYVSDIIKQPFVITYDEIELDPVAVAEKIEEVSSYTLLNINTDMDSYCFFVCKKSDKNRLIKIAYELEIPMVEIDCTV